MSGIYDELVGLEALSLGSLLIAGHSGHDSFSGAAFAAAGRLDCGRPAADIAARGLRGPPQGGGFLGPPAHHAGGTFFCLVTRFSCHCCCVSIFTPSSLKPWDVLPWKNNAPAKGSAFIAAVAHCHFFDI